MPDARETFAAGRLLLRTKAPYLSTLVMGLAPVEATAADGVETLGVTEHAVLLINWSFIEKLTPEQCAGVLAHECMHVCLEHCKRTRVGGLDPERSNIAQDLAINPAVVDMGLQMPTGDLAGVFPETKEYPLTEGFKRGLSADEYYELLRKHGKGGGGGGKVGQGRCGSCAGNPLPNEPGGKSPAARGTAEIDRMIRQVAEAIRDAKATAGVGSLPGFMQKWADDFIKPAVVPWNVKLGKALRSGMAWAAGALEHRYDGPSRRQAGLGYGVGRAVLPRLRAPLPLVAVILDTSGSMGTEETTKAMVETNGIIKAVGGNVTVCTADCTVAGIKKCDSIYDAVKLLKGGGGTDMNPAFDALLKEKPKPSVIVCITDGMIPEVPPINGVKVIWILVGPYRTDAAIKFGEVIEIPGPKHGAAA